MPLAAMWIAGTQGILALIILQLSATSVFLESTLLLLCKLYSAESRKWRKTVGKKREGRERDENFRFLEETMIALGVR